MKIGLIYGGLSPEHDVSIRSAKNILDHLTQHEVSEIYIDRKGNWPIQNIFEYLAQFDLIFPMIHGPNGEDGALQGLLRLAKVPFIGSDVASSAICMDKDVSKRLLAHANLPIAPHTTLKKGEAYSGKFSYPLYVKPANLGSSIGISKVSQPSQLDEAMELAFRYDDKILIEEEVAGEEVEISLLDDAISLPAKLTPMHEFHNYEAKFHDPDGCIFEVPANYPQPRIEKIQQLARKAYNVLECKGLARIDFFVNDEKVVINEVNTVPGFTKTSLFPRMWEASGISFEKLLDKLITQHAVFIANSP